MLVLDTSVLVSAYVDLEGPSARWLRDATGDGRPLAVPEQVIAGAIRILTNPRIFSPPLETAVAVGDLASLLSHPGVSIPPAGPRWWAVFSQLVEAVRARGNLVSDAAIAAHALDQDGVVVTLDRDFAKFPGLRYQLVAP